METSLQCCLRSEDNSVAKNGVQRSDSDIDGNHSCCCCREKVHFVEQFASEVLDFSSQYGSDTSISYTAYNLTGKPSKFPDYGDFPQVFVMKTYGNWWKECPSGCVDYMPQNSSRITSDDYIDVAFEQSVYPFRVSIYETYNPGTVVRIWAKNSSVVPIATTAKTRMWSLLYEGEALKVGHVPRIFSPVIKTIGFKTSVLRIEFNHSKSDYYTGIDAILLVGTKQPIAGPSRVEEQKNCCRSVAVSDKLSMDVNEKSSFCNVGKLTRQVYELNLHYIPGNNNWDLDKALARFNNNAVTLDVCAQPAVSQVIFPEKISSTIIHHSRFDKLPDETILKILGYLDLTSRSNCSQLDRRFHALANDPSLYTTLSLRPCWNKLNDVALLGFVKRCQLLRKLDLSWCGSYCTISDTMFNQFVIQCCKNLTHLRLNCCKQLVTNNVMKTVSEHCKQLIEIGLRNCTLITDLGFSYLANYTTRLENLDLYRTNITSNCLVSILKRNPNLLHLNIGSCIRITNMDEIASVISSCNRNIVSLDFWKTANLSQIGVGTLSSCNNLQEVDFGWCLGFACPIDCLAALAEGCPRLRKLFLTALRGICDKDLEPFLVHCPELEQIDLLGVRGITPDICSRLLTELPKLKLLDLSFCDQISDFHISSWKSRFPEVFIKRSFQTETTSNFLHII